MNFLFFLLGLVIGIVATKLLEKDPSSIKETSSSGGGGTLTDNDHRTQEHDDKEEPGITNEAY